MPVWHHAVSQCRGIQDVETGKKHCVDPTARYASKFQFDHLTTLVLLLVGLVRIVIFIYFIYVSIILLLLE